MLSTKKGLAWMSKRERAVVVVVVVTVVQEERWPIPRNTISRKQDLHSFL
jgi:hypothetical protein